MLERPRFSNLTFMGLPRRTDLDGVDYAVAGVPFDTGATYRVGARFGPAAIRSLSALLRPYNPATGVDASTLVGVDYGDLPVVPGATEESFRRITAALEPVAASSAVPLLLGGDHSVTLPELRAMAARHGPLALVQFDSHPDTWADQFGQTFFHGSPFYHAAQEGLVDPARSALVGLRGSVESADDLPAAERLGFLPLPAGRVRELGWDGLEGILRRRVAGRPVFVSFDIDFLDPAYAPGTGTPEVGGFTTAEALRAVRGLAGLPVVACDLVEVLPAYDPGQVTALAAANLVYEFIGLVAARGR